MKSCFRLYLEIGRTNSKPQFKAPTINVETTFVYTHEYHYGWNKKTNKIQCSLFIYKCILKIRSHVNSTYPILSPCVIAALGGTADVESIHMMMQEEEAKEKAFLEKLAKKLKDGGVSRSDFP